MSIPLMYIHGSLGTKAPHFPRCSIVGIYPMNETYSDNCGKGVYGDICKTLKSQVYIAGHPEKADFSILPLIYT